MSVAQGLQPDGRLFIQTAIFLASLVSVNLFIIQPALRLHNERKRRTSGAIDSAKAEETKADAMEQQYSKELKRSNEESRNLRISEVLAGQAESEAILGKAHENARDLLADIQVKLDQNVTEQRARIPELVSDIVSSILKQIGAVAVIFAALLFGMSGNSAFANEAEVPQVEFMSGIFWPYYQFIIFTAAIIYFGRKPIAKMLESRRDEMRARLSEAKQAVTHAEKRSAEFESKMMALQNEIKEMRAMNIEDGVKERTKIVAEAQQAAVQLIKDAERAAQELLTRAKIELKKELLASAIETVEQQLIPSRVSMLDTKLKSEVLHGIQSLS